MNTHTQSVTFHNSPARQRQEFTPLEPGRVTLYTCGPTVYNYLHVGNWVAYVRWDMLVRTLELSGYKVERVMNITDVGHLTGENEGDADQGEDKLEKGARREGKTAWEVAKMYTDDFLAGMQALALLPPQHITKATDYIPQQIALVKTLEEKGFTYIISDGVYFDTAEFPRYAEFAQLDLKALQEGARVTANPEKRNASDFAVWKFSPKDAKRDMEWDSPWGTGFPGWHLECSAMAMDILGETIDIHTGGIDHIPVHHTNEIAQSEAASGRQFVRYWLHNAHLLAEGTKISKSLGNGFTLQDIAKEGYSPLDFKMFVLQSHYRTESNFSWQNLAAAAARLSNWREFAVLRWQAEGGDDAKLSALIDEAWAAITKALQNDLDTPEALRHTDEIAGKLKAATPAQLPKHRLAAFIAQLDKAFGLQLEQNTPDITKAGQTLLDERQTALQNKDWDTSDQLRASLRDDHGIIVRDIQQDGNKRQLWSWTGSK
ncbi:cysteine--tRNA ligase [Candidatus Saccharibacteria bacterium]|nr:cysteine--tRNA ligase [Candidatus Saccharibacteria bacterium]